MGEYEFTGTDTGIIKVMQAYEKATKRMVDYYIEAWTPKPPEELMP